MHLHLGGIDFSKKFIINSYKLALILEDEIFSTLPKSRRNNAYCRKLKPFKLKTAISSKSIEDEISIEEDYNKIFKWISYEKVNNPNFEYNKNTQHPMGAKCSYNHDTPRYCWLNYVPAMFDTRGNKSYSIEARNHPGTTNFSKVKNWTLFFMSMMSFIERYPERIKEGLLMKDIIDTIMPKKSKSLNMYFSSRKELFSIDENEKQEYAKETSFNTKDIKQLIID